MRPLASFTEHGVRVDLSVDTKAVPEIVFTATFTPLDSNFYLYSKDFPRRGINGLGRPTLLEVESGGVLKPGILTESMPAKPEMIEGFEEPFMIYPNPPVTMTLAVTAPENVKNIPAKLLITYSACSLQGVCLVPVVRRPISAFISGDQISVKARTTHISYNPVSDPSRDLEIAIEQARAGNKRILMEIGGDWCIWCHKLDVFLEQNIDIGDFLDQHYVFMKVNVSAENENKAFLSKFPVLDGYPHMFVLENDGKLLHSQNTGELEEGAQYDREKVWAFLRQWSPQREASQV